LHNRNPQTATTAAPGAPGTGSFPAGRADRPSSGQIGPNDYIQKLFSNGA
jgi:hypothetical protein